MGGTGDLDGSGHTRVALCPRESAKAIAGRIAHGHVGYGFRVRGGLRGVEGEGAAGRARAASTILVVHDKDRVFALDNRCPHMGFPLDRGSVEDGTLTCHWHHARFDLASGCTFDLWADDVPTCPRRAA